MDSKSESKIISIVHFWAFFYIITIYMIRYNIIPCFISVSVRQARNGMILARDDIPPQYLEFYEVPSIASSWWTNWKFYNYAERIVMIDQ